MSYNEGGDRLVLKYAPGEEGTEIDFRDSGEVWIWTQSDHESHVVMLELRDLQSLMHDMEYLFRMEELQNLVEEMETDPMSDAVGHQPVLSDRTGRKYVTGAFVRRLGRQRHYINQYDAKLLVDEFFDGRG